MNKEDKNKAAGSEVVIKTVRVRFLLSPTGVFGLGYSAGEEADIEVAQAGEIVEACYGEYVK